MIVTSQPAMVGRRLLRSGMLTVGVSEDNHGERLYRIRVAFGGA